MAEGVTAQEYLSELVDFGGEMVPRGRMIEDLRATAREVAPDDPARQERIVGAYIAGCVAASRVTYKRKRRRS